MTAAASPVIDDGTFLDISGVLAAMFMGLLVTLRSAQTRGAYLTAKLAKVQGKREARIARGSDSYFEELRTIDTQIESLRHQIAQPQRAKWLDVALFGLAIIGSCIVAISTVKIILPLVSPLQPPLWSESHVSPVLLFVGASNFLLGFDTTNNHRRLSQITGGALLALAAIAIIAPFFTR